METAFSLYLTLRITLVKDESIAMSSSRVVTKIGTISEFTCYFVSFILFEVIVM